MQQDKLLNIYLEKLSDEKKDELSKRIRERVSLKQHQAYDVK